MQAPIAGPGVKIRLITCHYEVGPSDIKLMRTDTTLDHSQKAEKVNTILGERVVIYVSGGKEGCGLRTIQTTNVMS